MRKSWLGWSILVALIGIGFFGGCKPTHSEDKAHILYYQSPMHPWITSKKPGHCTICGMDLVPVHEGEAGIKLDPGMLSLNERSIQAIGISTAPVTEAPLTREIRLAGRLDEDEARRYIVAAFYDGRVEKVFVDHEGEDVVKDQPLAELYSPDLLYVVREFQVAAQRGSDPEKKNARQRLIQFGLRPEQMDVLAQGNRETYGIDLLSPVDGTVIRRNIYQGKYFKTGEPLVELADFSVMWFHAQVYERDFASIRLGEMAYVTTPAAPGKVFEGKVTFIDPNFDASTRSTRIRIEVSNPVVETDAGRRRELPHRAYAEATIRLDEGERLLVPRAAVWDDGRKAIVFVKKSSGVFERRKVKLGRRGDDSVEVLFGLRVGEEVVVNGNLLLDAESQLAHAGEILENSGEEQKGKGDDSFLPLLEAANRLSRALADEDIARFNQEAKALTDLVPLIDAWSSDAKQRPLLDEVKAHLTIPEASDLYAARKTFTGFSQAVSRWALAQEKSLPENFAVYECPMTGSSYAGAPTSGRWIQTQGTADNPYLGHAMRECGSEVHR